MYIVIVFVSLEIYLGKSLFHKKISSQHNEKILSRELN